MGLQMILPRRRCRRSPECGCRHQARLSSFPATAAQKISSNCEAVTGIGLPLGWAVSAYGLGRGLFVTIAMRRMDRRAAEQVYRAGRWPVFAQGAAMALAATVPLLNLLIPVIGTAAMVHVLDRTVERMRAG